MDVEYQKLVGDPDLLDKKGAEYQAIAKAIRDSVATLDDIVAQTSQKSVAMEATRTLAEDVATDIRKATDRYQETGDALSTYAVELRTAQDASEVAANAIVNVEADLGTWRGIVRGRQTAYDTAVAGGDADEISSTRRRLRSAEDYVTGLEQDLETNRRDWENARDQKVVAATKAANAIDDVVGGERGNDLNDDFWDHAGVWLDVLKFVCDIAAVLSIFLAWVPVLGQALLILAAVGALLAIVDAAIKLGKGEGSWGELFGAIALGVLALFGGKILGYLAKNLHRTIAMTVKPGVAVTKATKNLRTVVNIKPNYAQGVGGFFKSPFVRSVADVRRLEAFKKGVSFTSLLKHAAAQSNPFKLRNIFKFDGDVADLFHATTKLGDHLDAATWNKANLLVIGESLHVLYKNGKAVLGISESIGEGNYVDVGQEALGRLSGPMPKTVDKGISAVESFMSMTSNGTN